MRGVVTDISCALRPKNSGENTGPQRLQSSRGYSRKARENKRSHTDSISPSLAAEVTMHE